MEDKELIKLLIYSKDTLLVGSDFFIRTCNINKFIESLYCDVYILDEMLYSIYYRYLYIYRKLFYHCIWLDHLLAL